MNMQIDWDKYMKDHHIKIYTEEELKKQKMKKTIRETANWVKRHKKDFLNEYYAAHACGGE